MSHFPGYTEITCPFCNRYKHVKDELLPELAPRAYPGIGEVKDSIVCEDCWKIVSFFVKKAVKKWRSLLA